MVKIDLKPHLKKATRPRLSWSLIEKALKVQGYKTRIGETPFAAKRLGVSIDDIRLHNSHCDGYEEGWAACVEHIKKQLGL